MDIKKQTSDYFTSKYPSAPASAADTGSGDATPQTEPVKSAPIDAAKENTFDLGTFLKSQPTVTVEQAPAPGTEGTESDTGKAPAPEAPETTEPIGYEGTPIHDLNSMANAVTGLTGGTISNPDTLAEIVLMGIEFARSFGPSLLFRVMFPDDERRKLEIVLAKYIDIDKVGISKDMVPLKPSAAEAKEDEQYLILKWRKYNLACENYSYNEKDRATVKHVLHEWLKNQSIDSLIARFGPIIGMIVLEFSKASPFLMNRKQGLIQMYRA